MRDFQLVILLLDPSLSLAQGRALFEQPLVFAPGTDIQINKSHNKSHTTSFRKIPSNDSELG